MSKLVGFIGAPGTGKTTLACAMKEYALLKDVASDVCTEYAREFCFRFGISSDPYASYHIILKQLDRENALLNGSNEYIFTDSPAILGYVFPLLHTSRNASDEDKAIVADVYERFVINQSSRYYKIFYLKNDNPYDDGCRDMKINKHIASVFDGFVLSHQHMFPIVTVDISIEETEKRKEFVWEHLEDK